LEITKPNKQNLTKSPAALSENFNQFLRKTKTSKRLEILQTQNKKMTIHQQNELKKSFVRYLLGEAIYFFLFCNCQIHF
jgi:hypothetical protein